MAEANVAITNPHHRFSCSQGSQYKGDLEFEELRASQIDINCRGMINLEKEYVDKIGYSRVCLRSEVIADPSHALSLRFYSGAPLPPPESQ